MAGFLETIARWTRSPAFKLGLIAFLILLLFIPLFIVGGLVSERESRAREVRTEVGRIWGPEQRLQGPFLVVPYTAASKSCKATSASNKFKNAAPFSLLKP